MKNLQDDLKKNGYKKIPFKISKTQHLLIKASINNLKGNFILDTGASNSCIDSESVAYFNLDAKKSKTTASGAGATGMKTKIADNNLLKLGSWKQTDFTVVIFDLSHVNEALESYKVKKVHGIIGADILLKGRAIIDYYNHNLYLLK
jgi:predicted aspartyl protease